MLPRDYFNEILISFFFIKTTKVYILVISERNNFHYGFE